MKLGRSGKRQRHRDFFRLIGGRIVKQRGRFALAQLLFDTLLSV